MRNRFLKRLFLTTLFHCFGVVSLLFSLTTIAQDQTNASPESSDRGHEREELSLVGPHHRQLEIRDQEGNVASRYTQLQTGLMRQLEDGSWTETSTEIELFKNGAIARKTRHQVIFSPDSDDPAGVFDVLMPDGKRLRGQCIGLAFTDPTSGDSVFIGEMRSVEGEIVGKNEVFYRDCFSGDVRADLRYRVTHAGVVQDVILRSNVPSPEEYGLPINATLEVWTQFIDAPEATKIHLDRTTKGGRPVADCYIDFGSMSIGQGRAFPVLENEIDIGGPNFAAQISVHKAYEMILGMQFLIETVPYRDVADPLATLPAPPRAARQDRAAIGKALAEYRVKREERIGTGQAKPGRGKPLSLAIKDSREDSKQAKPWQIARRSGPDLKLAGYILDFDLNAGTVTDFTFQSDTTYYVTGTVYLNGTTAIEGGTVIKFANTNSPQLAINTAGTLTMKTAQYRPAFFVAKDDNSVGSAIAGSTGSPGTSLYAQTAICYLPSTPMSLSHINVRNADYALYLGNGQGAISNAVTHAQFVNCGNTIVVNGTSLRIRNALFYNCTRAFWTVSTDYHCEHVTFDQLGSFVMNFGGTSFAITNSIFCNVGTLPSINGTSNVTNNTAGDLFQEIGAAKHYLKTSYRNSGTTQINPYLAEAIKTRTTYSPILLTSQTLPSSQFIPAVQRDTDQPDIGYHYDPLDYVFSSLYSATDSEIIVLPGTAIGVFGQSGLTIQGRSLLRSSGTAQNPVRLASFMCVQEHSSTSWDSPTVGTLLQIYGDESPTIISARPAEIEFSQFYMHQDPNSSTGFGLSAGTITNTVFIRHSEFYNAKVSSFFSPLKATNCWFGDSLLKLFNSGGTTLQNCSFRRGKMVNQNVHVSNYPTVNNSLFEAFLIDGYPSNAVHNYNGYASMGSCSGCSWPLTWNRFVPNGGNDVVINGPVAYSSGRFGHYYHSATNFIDRGNTNASAVGLYHFTTKSNQEKEKSSIVDIGFHYPADPGVPSSSGLRGYWKFDEGTGTTAADSSGSGYIGTLNNGATWATGRIGSSTSLDGSNDYVQVGSQFGLVMSTSLTMTAWIYPTPGDGIVICKEGEYEFAVTSGSIQWAFANSSPGWAWVNTGYSPPTSQWSHIAITYNAGLVRTYANGLLVHSYSGSGNVGDVIGSQNDFQIGGRQAVVQYFNGRIDEARVYNRALSDGEIIATAYGESQFDTDSDGTPDYSEDLDGDGTLDSGETSPFSATDPGLKVFITEPKANSNIP